MAWPVVAVAGGPRERGRAYGAGARDRIHGSLELYEEVFRHAAGMRWREVVDRAGAFAGAIDAYDVRLLPELEGIAEGAAVEAEDILALNLRTEVMFGMAAGGCTGVCAPTDGGEDAHVLLAQNWDWKPGARATCVLLVASPHDAAPFATFVEAGLLAKVGVNGAGVGVAANALTSSLDRGEVGVPFHAILRRVLTSSSFDEAVDAVASPVRASSANYLIASRDGRAADLEAAPGGRDAVTRFDGDRLAHANHFLATPGGDGARGKDLERLGPSSSSVARQAAAEAVASPAGRTIDELLTALADHDAPVCQHAAPDASPSEAYETIAAVAMDLTEGAIWITEGRPCTTAAERSDLPSLVALAD